MEYKFDIAVVGAGVLGSFHAYHALAKGLSVALVERNGKPCGATVRNFGQVVPSGMDTKWQTYGRESLEIYKSIQSKFDISIRNNGTVYVASNAEEVALIEELNAINAKNGYPSYLLSKQECLSRYDGLRESYCKMGLFFPDELTVEPLTMINRLHEYMQQHMGLKCLFNTTAVHVWEDEAFGKLITSYGDTISAQKIIICNGDDFKTLYPKLFDESDLEVTKLQMLQTKQQGNYKLSGSILTGLTIRRYEAFKECPSYTLIKSREDPHSFEKCYGVHILFKQALDGSVIIGDSHEYADARNADDINFFNQTDIDNFMITEAKKIIELPTYDIQCRWFGTYAQCKTKDVFEQQIGKNIHVITGIGGKGMTGSAGYSKHIINSILK